MRDRIAGAAVFVVAAQLAACGYSNAGSSASPGGGGSATLQEFFATQVEPNMGFCRTCHIAGGVADTPGSGPGTQGNLFLLSGDSSRDYDNVMAAWTSLGKGVDSNRLLIDPSDSTKGHAGGQPWPPSGQPYAAMKTLLSCWNDPAGCSAALSTYSGNFPPPQNLPLLGSAHGGHLWSAFCEGKSDDTALPPDPRSLVVEGANRDKAVFFNAYWRNCHANPSLVGEQAHPATCGEWRGSVARGAQLMVGNGAVGAGTFFAASQTTSVLTLPASTYNELWKVWGLTSRPDNFDELVTQRYGGGATSARNPYPLPGEDPNQSDGGSGQLPLGMTQTRNADGSWSGVIGLTCNGCHSSAIGNPADGSGPGALYGAGNSLADTGLIGRDFGIAAHSLLAAFSLFGKNRGTNNASDVNLFYLVNQEGGLRIDQYTLGLLTSGSTASGDTPSWWNVGHRPVKFQDGILPGDSVRTDLVFYMPFSGLFGKGDPDATAWMRTHDQDADNWLASLRSPAYQLPVNTALAEQGAILFHNKNLWAPELNNPVPAPDGGNGSCASCHGAYSPRFVNDSAFLDTPALEGIAAYIVPKDVIGTDPARVDTNNEAVQQYGTTSFLNYPETVGMVQDCGPQNRAGLRPSRQPGYLAPPLYGVWATAPYFHNGSVPDVWGVLKTSDRPPMWQRVSTPARPDQMGKVVMGFDTDLRRAYDADRLGWKYTTPACGSGNETVPYLQCNPADPEVEPVVQKLLALLYGNLIGVWNLSNAGVWKETTPEQIDERKTYNTHLYSQGNEGHAFTEVLTDDERKALIEYLKTL
jgi:mono/diheme cytochrome c family protein